MSALCWTEKQRKLKQHARETAARRRKWEKIAADQEAEEETKLKKALEQRKRELESKNRYLRQPLAKPPPAKRTFLTKGSKKSARLVDRRDDSLASQGKGSRQDGQRRNATAYSSHGAADNHGRENLKAFIKEKRAALRGGRAVEDDDSHVALPRKEQWKNLKKVAGAEFDSILNRYTSSGAGVQQQCHGAPPETSQRLHALSATPRENEDHNQGFGNGFRLTTESEAPDLNLGARPIPHSKPPRPPPAMEDAGTSQGDELALDVSPESSCEDPAAAAGAYGLRRGCVSTARHRPAPRMVFSADSLDGSAVELMVPDQYQGREGRQITDTATTTTTTATEDDSKFLTDPAEDNADSAIRSQGAREGLHHEVLTEVAEEDERGPKQDEDRARLEPTFALPASFPDTLAPSGDTTTTAAVCLHDSLEASIDPLLEAEPMFGGDTGAWVGGHQSIRKDESRHRRAEEVTGSVLELKYFGSLAAGAAKEVHCTSAGGEGKDAETSKVSASLEPNQEPLAWWCDGGAKVSENSLGTGPAKNAWQDGSLLNTTNGNKNKLPKRNASLSLNRYRGCAFEISTETTADQALKSLQREESPFASSALKAQHSRVIGHHHSTVVCVNRALAGPDPCSDYTSVMKKAAPRADGSDYGPPVIRSKAKASHLPPPKQRQAKQWAQAEGGRATKKKAAALAKKRPALAEKKPKPKATQGVEGPLMCKGSYAQSVLEKAHVLSEMAASARSKSRPSGPAVAGKHLESLGQTKSARARSVPPPENHLGYLGEPVGPQVMGPPQPSPSPYSSPPPLREAEAAAAQGKAQRYKYISPSDLEAFTRPATLHYADRVRDKVGLSDFSQRKLLLRHPKDLV